MLGLDWGPPMSLQYCLKQSVQRMCNGPCPTELNAVLGVSRE